MAEQTWRDTLPDDLKADPSLTKFADPAALARSYKELEAYRGTSLRIPGPDAPEADRKEFVEKIKKLDPNLVELPPEKRPVEKPEDVTFDGVTFEAGTELSTQEQTEFRKWAHDRGLTKAAAKAELERLAKSRSDGLAARSANEKELRVLYGQAFDDKVKGLRILAEKIGAPAELKEAIEKRTVPKEVAQWLERVGSQLGHDTRELANLGGTPAPRMTPEEARQRHREAMRKANDPTVSREEAADAWRKAQEYLAIADPSLLGG